MPGLTLIDTDILIDAGRGVSLSIDYLRNLESDTRLAISAVTQMELIVGCRNKDELRDLGRFVDRFQVLQIDENTSEGAIELLNAYRLTHGLLIADALIASTAMSWGVPLVSKNQRDYRFIEGLDLLPYPPPESD